MDELLFCVRKSHEENATILQKDKFALACSKKLMRSWASQPSPCCAAACVGKEGAADRSVCDTDLLLTLRVHTSSAGALNALSLDDSDPWTSPQVMEYYKAMTRDRIARKKQQLEIRSGGECGHEIDRLEGAVRNGLVATGEYQLGVRCNVAPVDSIVDNMALADGCGFSFKQGTKKIPRKLLLHTARSVLTESPTEYPVLHNALRSRESAERNAPDASVHETSSGKSVAFEIDLNPRDKHVNQLLNVLYEYLHLVDGLGKLERVEKPSTAICGNEAILRAVEAISSSETDRKRLRVAGDLVASLFMGTSQGAASCASRSESSSSTLLPHRRVTWQISLEDSEMQRTAAWRTMWAEFSNDCSVLIYHLKNHYALVFAMREWQDEEQGDGKSSARYQHREILTARKGQHPSAWIEWEEVYSTLCSWNGYKIIRVGIE